MTTLNLSGLKAGTYYVKAYNADKGYTFDYSLAWDFYPPEDKYEDNDTLGAAPYLTGLSGTYKGLTHHTEKDVDFFCFSLDRNGASSYKISAAGDANVLLRLYDSKGKALKSAAKTVNLSGLKQGQSYYVKAYNAKKQATDSYSLSWSFYPAKDAREGSKGNNTKATATVLKERSGTIKNLTIHSEKDVDYFKFTLSKAAKSGYYIETGGNGDVLLRLYDSKGKDLKKSGAVLDLSKLKAGTYYVRASGFNSQPVNSYALSWDFRPPMDSYEYNDIINSGYFLDEQSGSVKNLTFHSKTDADFFSFYLYQDGVSSDRISAAGDGNVRLQLYDNYGNAVKSAAQTVSLSGLHPGQYHVKAYNVKKQETDSYSISWNFIPPKDAYEGKKGNNTLSTATLLKGKSGTLKNLTIHTAKDVDYFKFRIAKTAPGEISVNQNSDVWLKLYDSKGNEIDRGSMGKYLNLKKLEPGVYYAQALNSSGGTTSSYSLSWNLDMPKDAFEPNNSRSRATVLYGKRGFVGGLTFHTDTDQDYYKFTLTANGTAKDTLQVYGNPDLYLRVYNSAGKEIKSGASSYSLSGLKAGTYYATLYKTNGKPSHFYSLSWNLNSSIAGDNFESNNTIKTATLLPGSRSVTGADNKWLTASIHSAKDVDYYKIHLDKKGTVSDKVSTSSDLKLGNLDMTLYNSKGKLLAKSASTESGLESLSLMGRSAGDYYVKIYGCKGAKNDYALTWNLPSSSAASTLTGNGYGVTAS